MGEKTGLVAQKAILKLHLETHLRADLPNMKKHDVDQILSFVDKYFGQEMHGKGDKSEFREMVVSISKNISEVTSDETN